MAISDQLFNASTIKRFNQKNNHGETQTFIYKCNLYLSKNLIKLVTKKVYDEQGKNSGRRAIVDHA